MRKLLVIGGALLLVGTGAGGGLAYYKLWDHRDGHAVASKPSLPKPVFFASLNDVIVSVPATTPSSDDDGDPPSQAFVQFGIEFQTEDATQVTNFSTVEPVIKSGVMQLLEQQNGQSINVPSTQVGIEKGCLALVNSILQSRHYSQKAPFNAAYITSLVVQD